LGFIGSLSYFIPIIGEYLCFFSDKIIDPFISIILYISRFIASLPGSIYYLPIPDLMQILLFYLLLLFFTFQIKLDFKQKTINIAFISFFIIFAAITAKHFSNNTLKIMFFDIKGVESALITTKDKKNIFISTLNQDKLKYNPANSIIIPYFRDKGIYKIDEFITLNYDDSSNSKDYITYILENVKISNIYINNQNKTNELVKLLFKYQNNLKTKYLYNNQIINPSKYLKITVLNISDSPYLHITSDNFSGLIVTKYNNNLFFKTQKKLKSPLKLIKILNNKQSTLELQRFIKPETAIITNKLIKNFNNSRIYATEVNGSIEITVSHDNISIKPFKKL